MAEAAYFIALKRASLPAMRQRIGRRLEGKMNALSKEPLAPDWITSLLNARDVKGAQRTSVTIITHFNASIRVGDRL